MQRIFTTFFGYSLFLLALIPAGFSASAQDINALQTSAEHGEAHAQYLLARAYFHGAGVAQSDALARQWYEKAAAQGDAEAQAAMGFLCAEGRGGIKDAAEAKRWLQLAAAQNLASAQHNLGVLLLKTPDASSGEGLALLEKAASNGYVSSQIKLGQIYYYGDCGVAQDYAKAFGWFQKAASTGDGSALNILGTMYNVGQGVKQDPPEAFKCFQLAAENGQAAAQGNLGYFYAAGSVVPRDATIAYKWFKLGAQGGDVGSANQLTEISRALSADQIKEGEALAASFQPKANPSRP